MLSPHHRLFVIRATAVALVVAALALWKTGRPGEPSGSPTPGVIPPARQRAEGPGTRGPLSHEVVTRMGGDDWQARFTRDDGGVSAENREAIVELAGELQWALSHGAEPDGPDAQVYVETILTLANDRSAE
ncbi:hypothetical protein Hsar01_02622 [Haloferula sargassicola]|uniref:DUF4129 domain-containing protein n=2 Tax=Haloferula sargassicola TaxID=490096 RepID=A0ABP9USN9_9BACT